MGIKGPLKLIIFQIRGKILQNEQMRNYHAHRIAQIHISDMSNSHKKYLLKYHYGQYDKYKNRIKILREKEIIISSS